jgi:hypothetical protein
LRIQRRGGFVTQQDIRIVRQRAGNSYTLFLPAAELGRIRIFTTAQPNQRNQFSNPLFD